MYSGNTPLFPAASDPASNSNLFSSSSGLVKNIPEPLCFLNLERSSKFDEYKLNAL